MIYVISHYYPPVQNAPANRMNYLVKVLAKQYGPAKVQVITGRPNHPGGQLPPEYKWRLYKRKEGEWGETILSLYEMAAPNKGFLRKTLGYISFAVSVGLYFLFKPIRNNDVIFVTSPPIFPAYVIYYLSKLKRKFCYIMEVRDLWPEAIAGIGFIRKGSFVYNFFLSLTHKTYGRATRLIGVSEGITQELAAIVKGKDITLIRNPVNTEHIRLPPSQDIIAFKQKQSQFFGDTDKTTFLYSGVHAAYIDLITLMKALKEVRKITSNFIFLLVGDGEDKKEMQDYVVRNKLNKQVFFLSFMARKELLHYISAVDFCYASLKDTSTLRYAIPTKILEFLACNKAVIVALAGPFADMLKQHGVAFVVPPGNPVGLSQLIIDLIQNKERRPEGLVPRDFIHQEFSLDGFNQQMIDLFGKETGGRA